MLTAIVLAAGLSKRMGKDNKMLLHYKSKTIIAVTVENIIASGIKDIIVVTGFEQEKIHETLTGLPVRFVHNTDYEKGMTTSIQQGVANAEGDGYMICPGDMIHITPAEYASLSNSFAIYYTVDKACILLPFYRGEKGNPVIFSRHYKEAILQHTEMKGCKNIVKNNQQHIIKVEMPTKHVLMDMDYPEDYEKLRQDNI